MTSHAPLIPSKYKILSGSALKLIALISMIIDHIGYFLLVGNNVVLLKIGNHSLTLYEAMRFVGRWAFPIYAFLLVEGFIHTHDRRKYGLKLLVFALISEIPWNLAHTGKLTYSSQNVFFTLFMGFLGLCLVEKIRSEDKDRLRSVVLLFVLFVISVIFKADYGCSGFGFILLLYLLRDVPVFRTVIGCCFLSSRWKVIPSFVLISLYNGKRGAIKGTVFSILFYAIYPIHILIFYFIRLKIIGY